MIGRWQRGARIVLLLTTALASWALPAAATKKDPPPRPVDINVANIKELEELPGVGKTTAQSIIDFRQKSGRFRRVEDLLVIRGISRRKLELMRPYLTVGAPQPPLRPAAKPAPRPAPKPVAKPAAPAKPSASPPKAAAAPAKASTASKPATQTPSKPAAPPKTSGSGQTGTKPASSAAKAPTSSQKPAPASVQ